MRPVPALAWSRWRPDVLAFLTGVVLLAAPASAAPTVVQFEAKGSEADVEALRVSLDDWLRPMKLSLRRVQQLPTGIDDEIAARVRVVWGELNCVVEVFQPDGVLVRHKELPISGAPLLVSETAALVAHAGISEFVATRSEVTSSTQPPLVTAPAPSVTKPPVEIGVAAWFQSRSWDERSPFVFGGGGEVNAALPLGSLRPALSLLLAYQGPVARSVVATPERSEVNLSMQALSVRLLPGARSRLGMFEFEAGIGGGIDFMIASTSSSGLPPRVVRAERLDVAPFFSADLGVRFHPTSSSGVMLRLLLDVDPARRRYVSNVGGETMVLAVPWAVRPMIQLGFTFDIVRAP